MSTKCIVLGQEKKEKELKKIEFVKHLNEGSKFEMSYFKPNAWENIELISCSYTEEGMDLIFAYDEDRNRGSLYLGHWNDGVV